jgi:hypothetical protein
VLADRALAASMSRAAVHWVAEAGWDRVGERTAEAYARHLGRRARSPLPFAVAPMEANRSS